MFSPTAAAAFTTMFQLRIAQIWKIVSNPRDVQYVGCRGVYSAPYVFHNRFPGCGELGKLLRTVSTWDTSQV